MKTILVVLIGTITSYNSCKTAITEKTSDSVLTIPKRADTIDFKTQVQPILEKRCSPCHFNGGKMYSKMPFDSSRTIITHEAGILRRLKDEQENEMVRNFVLNNSKQLED